MSTKREIGAADTWCEKRLSEEEITGRLKALTRDQRAALYQLLRHLNEGRK